MPETYFRSMSHGKGSKADAPGAEVWQERGFCL